MNLLVLDMIMHPEQKAVITSGFSETDQVKETQKLTTDNKQLTH